MASLAAAQAAKDSLRQKLWGQPWFRGVGLVQLKCMGPDPYELQVLVDSAETALALRSCPQTPKSWLGVPFSFTVVRDLAALGATPAAQDYANLALGAMCLVGTFMVGRIAVDSIIAARKERFEAKGQSPAAVKAKETTMDGLFKALGMGLGLYQLSQDLPVVLSEAKKLLR